MRIIKNIVNKEYFLPSLLSLIGIGVVYFSRNFPFYWDNVVQLSYPASQYYNEGIGNLALHNEYATGHPVFMPLYLSICWSIFGKTLIVSHFAFLPFVIGFMWQLPILIKNLGVTDKRTSAMISFFVIADAAVLSQVSLITFEISHLFALLLAINAILEKRPLILTFALILLCFSSMRGSISALGLGLFYSIEILVNEPRRFFKKMLPFIIGAAIIISYYSYFYSINGWIIHNPYAFNDCGEVTTIPHMFFKLAVIGWRFVDMGRALVSIIFIILLFRLVQLRTTYKEFPLFIKVIVFQLAVFVLFTIYSMNTIGPRYFLPVFILVNIISLCYIFSLSWRFKKWLISLNILMVVIGHTWVYPPKIAQSWDCTPLHWTYFELCDSMDSYVKNRGINCNNVTSFIFNTDGRHLTKLVSDTTFRYSYYDGGVNKDYVIYSNCFNTTDDVIDSLNNPNIFTEVKCYKKNQLFIKLLKSNK